MEEITVNNVKPMFLTRDGLPKKECLKCNDDIMNELDRKISAEKYKKHYENNLINAVNTALRKFFRNNHMDWVDVKIGKIVYHGFTKDEDKIKNSLQRQFQRMKRAGITFTKSKNIAQSQVQITFDFEDEKPGKKD